jgi:hypothetical protein
MTLRAEVVEEPHHEQLPVLLRVPVLVKGDWFEKSPRYSIRQMKLSRLHFERHRRAGQILHDTRGEAAASLKLLDARNQRDVLIGLIGSPRRPANGRWRSARRRVAGQS